MSMARYHGEFSPNPSIFNSHRRQYFSLPSSIIYYIIQNPISADGLLKLQKICKYFFAKNKTVVCNDFIHQENDILLYLGQDVDHSFKNAANFWLNNGLRVQCSMLTSNLVYRCTLKELNIYSQNLTLNEFDFLFNDGKMEELTMTRINIFDDHGIRVSIDKILAKTPNLQSFIYECPDEIYTTEIFEKMNSLKLNSIFKKMTLVFSKISENADISLLSKFITKNPGKVGQTANFRFHFFIQNIIRTKNILRTAVNEALKNWDDNMKPTVYIY